MDCEVFKKLSQDMRPEALMLAGRVPGSRFELKFRPTATYVHKLKN
jgi:hypothetical protein